MAAADRTLLRLHVEAVWGVRLPALVRNDVELLQESPLPSWKLCAAEPHNTWQYGQQHRSL